MDTRFATLLVEQTIRELHARAERHRLIRTARQRPAAEAAGAPSVEAPVASMAKMSPVAGEAVPQPALGD